MKDGAKYKADLSSANTYYPFGMLMPERNWSSEWYRYGFQGQEKNEACAESSRSKGKAELLKKISQRDIILVAKVKPRKELLR